MFATLVADPPWQFDQHTSSESGKFHGTTDDHYPTLDIEAIKRFPLPPMLPDSHLFLWRVAAMQREALDVIDAWGFTLKSEIVWKKLTKNGKRWFGMGRQVRAEHETCLIAVRGRGARTENKGIRSVFEAMVPEGKHSAKPGEFFEIVQSLTVGPYVELFARRTRPGWTCYGNEVAADAPDPELDAIFPP